MIALLKSDRFGMETLILTTEIFIYGFIYKLLKSDRFGMETFIPPKNKRINKS